MSTVVDPDTGQHEAVAPIEAPDEPATETEACPNCGAPADPGQLMCLECGSRLALDYQRAPSWRLPAAIVGVVVLLAGIGVAIALATVTGDAGKTTAAAPAQPAATPPAPSAPADTPQTTPSSPPTASTPTPAPTGTAATATPAPTETAATPTPAPATTSTGWPPGKSAFTVILASMPSKAAADDKLAKAKAAGITTAAILHSDDFPTLRPGYWVVFDGQYDTVDQATSQAQADRGKGEFTDAYQRFVSKDPNAKP